MMLKKLSAWLRPRPRRTDSEVPDDQPCGDALRAYVADLPAASGNAVEAMQLEEVSGLAITDLTMRALTASRRIGEVNQLDEQIAILMFIMFASTTLLAQLRKEGHELEHDKVVAVASAAFLANQDEAGRRQVFTLGSELFRRFVERIQASEELDSWMDATTRIVWGQIVEPDLEMHKAMSGHYLAMRHAVRALREGNS